MGELIRLGFGYHKLSTTWRSASDGTAVHVGQSVGRATGEGHSALPG